MSSQGWILISVVFYMSVMVLIGFLSSRLIKDTLDYIVAGRRLGIVLSVVCRDNFCYMVWC